VSRPTLFVGSSSEGFRIAQAVQVNLDGVCEVKLWTQGVFGLTRGTLESLVTAADEFDFAVLVLTSDDLNISRGTAKPAARDNVLFELGLFIGSLGRDRTFILYNGADRPALPSDLAGVTTLTFVPHSDGNLVAALGASCTRIQDVIDSLGIRHNKGGRTRQGGGGGTQNTTGWLSGLHDGSEVAHRETVSGVVVGLPPGAEAWILVQPAFEATYWPQRNLLLGQTGGFQAVAQFGRRGMQDIGEEYVLLLAMAPPAASARFREFKGKDASEGMPELPPDVVTLARVTVTRR
jgi:Predicted nucleotide-binding protein containing TIR-like domain